MLYRFRRRRYAKLDVTLIDASLEPRLNQILLPLLSIADDPSLRSELRSVARDAQANLVAERGLLPEAQALEILIELMAVSDSATIPIGHVTAEMIERYGAEYSRPITNRWVGGIVRKRLGLHTYKSHGVYVLPISERTRAVALCAKYGIDSPSPAQPEHEAATGDMGTMGTS